MNLSVWLGWIIIILENALGWRLLWIVFFFKQTELNWNSLPNRYLQKKTQEKLA